MTLILINEFSDTNCPVTKLVYDLGEWVSQDKGQSVVQLNLGTKYRPGGLGWIRVLSLLIMHLITPYRLFYHRIKCMISKSKMTVIVTTLPPFIHWTTVLFCKLIQVKVILWYMDAHPEIEIRKLRSKSFFRLANILSILERFFIPQFDEIVTLDEGMAELLSKSTGVSRSKIRISSPWATFVSPTTILRQPVLSKNRPLRLVYAGNYGQAHDLAPLADMLKEIVPLTPIELVGMGMNNTSAKRFEKNFADIGNLTLTVYPRFESVSHLVTELAKFDLGIVSLNADYLGIASPSKAFTYISQGLPILYIGPQKTLSDSLVKTGYGYNLESFTASLSTQFPVLSKANTHAKDPKHDSMSVFLEVLNAHES
ncbi:MAG: hypothetical protein NT027_00670 [Proteobacteria bacterium]|nr:hypothetical protein [Pseudomonadota bacterium]